jgi:FG-GAP-like repeat
VFWYGGKGIQDHDTFFSHGGFFNPFAGSTALIANGVHVFDGTGLSGALLYDAGSGTAYTALSNGTGAYQYTYNLFTPGFDTLRTGDFNGDGLSDLAVYNSKTALAYIGMGNGDGTFTFQSLFWSPGYDFVEAADLNGDGKTDFALYNSAVGTMYTGISNGTGGFTTNTR